MGTPFYTDCQNTRYRGYGLYRTAPLVFLSVFLNLIIFHHYFLSSTGYQCSIALFSRLILLLLFKSLNNLAPTYISDLLTQYIPRRTSLRSSKKVVVPRSIQKTYGERALALAGSRLWNDLIYMRQPGISLATFKRSEDLVV